MQNRTTVMIDANLLVLWIVGQVSLKEIPRFRRTRKYTETDFYILSHYLGNFRDVIITPNIATEASNLIGALYGDYLSRARYILAAGLQVWKELYIKSSIASEEPEFRRLGLTDAAILLSTRNDTEVVTDDFDLYRSLINRRIPVTNFTHLRTAGWLDE